ncbi:hypothetical protein RHIZ404_220029 [Rhizobium sp. EC-SD404]|nr:hypothetical protein RHIZ404_220029 [Rhizobium sp. EC-SD404]
MRAGEAVFALPISATQSLKSRAFAENCAELLVFAPTLPGYAGTSPALPCSTGITSGVHNVKRQQPFEA